MWEREVIDLNTIGNKETSLRPIVWHFLCVCVLSIIIRQRTRRALRWRQRIENERVPMASNWLDRDNEKSSPSSYFLSFLISLFLPHMLYVFQVCVYACMRALTQTRDSRHCCCCLVVVLLTRYRARLTDRFLKCVRLVIFFFFRLFFFRLQPSNYNNRSGSSTSSSNNSNSSSFLVFLFSSKPTKVEREEELVCFVLTTITRRGGKIKKRKGTAHHY